MAYTKEEIESSKSTIIDSICNGKSLKQTLEQNPQLPSRPIVYEWMNVSHKKYDETFLNNYARACEERAEAIFDEILEIADEKSGDIKIGPNGEESLNSEFVARSRVRLDARKWVLGRMKPKKYGDKVLLGNDPENPLPPASIPLVLSNGKSFDDLKNELKPE